MIEKVEERSRRGRESISASSDGFCRYHECRIVTSRTILKINEFIDLHSGCFRSRLLAFNLFVIRSRVELEGNSPRWTALQLVERLKCFVVVLAFQVAFSLKLDPKRFLCSFNELIKY